MKIVIHPKFEMHTSKLSEIIDNFENNGELFGDENRNKIKIFELDNFKINIKSFKVPSTINKFVYKYIRKSKASRSYIFALNLINSDLGTPEPIGYFEETDIFGLKKSYYISKHLDFDIMYRDLVENQNYPDWENILRQFIQFSYKLHELGVEFLDHSPGNTLIKRQESGFYKYYLVDLNRMKFHSKMDFNSRMNNLKKLTPHREMVAIMSNEYSKLYNKHESEIFEKLWLLTTQFQEAYFRKKRFKKKLKFWK